MFCMFHEGEGMVKCHKNENRNILQLLKWGSEMRWRSFCFQEKLKLPSQMNESLK